jgi:hypothetical protein
VTRIPRRTFTFVASLLALLLVGIIVLAYTTRLGHERARVPNAPPLWNGDTFTIRKIDSDLPPYQFSSASGPTAGWLQPNSNTDPSVDGVTVVPDPTGLRSSTGRGGVRKVIKITTDDARAFNGRYVRTELRGPEMFRSGDYRWVIAEIYVPRETPVLPARPGIFWTVLSIFGSPYVGPSPLGIQLARNSAGTGNDIVWKLPNGMSISRTPATPGVWHIIARRIRFSTNPTIGWSEVWYSQRAPDGTPTTPLIRQVVGGYGAARWIRRRSLATLDPSRNWDGSTVRLTTLISRITTPLTCGRSARWYHCISPAIACTTGRRRCRP